MLKLKNVLLSDPASGREEHTNIYIEGGRIAEIGEFPGMEASEEIDCGGLYAAPGFVDVHVHFRDPGQTAKEDIITCAAAAAKGGYTSLVGMANTVPTVSDLKTLRYVLEQGAKTGLHIYSAATLTMGMKGKSLVPMEELAAAGAACFTDDGRPVLDEELLRQAFLKAKALNRVVSLHEEDPQFIGTPGVNAGEAAKALGLNGAEAKAEWSMVKRDLALALETGAAVDFQHISAKESVKFIRDAVLRGMSDMERDAEHSGGRSGLPQAEADSLERQDALPGEGDMPPGVIPKTRRIHGEATPHHFTLTEQAVSRYGTLAKMNPPLRPAEDREAIIAGLKDNTLDIIATDHAPHTTAEKNRPFPDAPSGITGLETAFSLGITRLVREGHLTMQEFLAKLTVNPARAYGLPAGELTVGKTADIVIFDPEEKYIVNGFLSKASNSPFFGAELYGRIKMTVSAGIPVWRSGL